MADDISVGSVSAEVVPDASGFAAKLKTELKGISIAIGITVDTAELRSQLEEVTRDRSATINVDADTTAAEAQIDEASRDRTANVDVDSSGIARAGSDVSGLAVAIIALGPALIPIIGAVAALGAGLSAPLAAAGGGLTIFGLLAGKAIGDTNKIAKQIETLHQKASTLVDPAAAQAAKDQADALEASLSGPQKAFLKAKEALSGAFAGLLGGASGAALFTPIVAGMNLLAQILPTLTPLLQSVSKAITDLFSGISANSSGFKDFIGTFSGAAYKAIVTFGKIFANFGRGLFGVFSGFAPVSKAFMGGLLAMSASFAKFGATVSTNDGFQSFVAYMLQTGPMVLATIGSLIQALVHIGVALAPLGAVALGSIKFLSDVISAIPTPVLGALASAIAAIVVALKLWSIAQAVLNVLLTANPIGAIIVAVIGLVAALVYAYKNSETFRNIVNGAFTAVKAVAGAVLSFLVSAITNTIGFIRAHWKLIASILGGPIAAAAILIISNFGRIKSGISSGISGAIGFVKSIPGKIKSALGSLSTLLFHAGQELMQGLADGIKSAIGKVTGAVSGVASKVKGFFPGSPVKEGPLVSWNDGGAGKRLGSMLADGIDNSTEAVTTSTARLASAVVAPVASRTDAVAPKAASQSTPILEHLLQAIAGLGDRIEAMQVLVSLGVDKRTAAQIVQKGISAGVRLA